MVWMVSAVTVLLSYEENRKWLFTNFEALKKEFNNQWVAVLGKKVIDHDKDLSTLVGRLQKKHSAVYSQIAVEYVTTNELDLIL
jgi:hypothetical protein